MRGLINKVKRISARGIHRAPLPKLDESIVSFSFDDCPSSAISTGLPMLEEKGWHATIFVACGLCETTNHLGRHMSLSDIVATHERGHEIADHTYSHLSAHNVSVEEFLADIEKNQNALKALGLPESRHFAYPFGHVTPALKSALSEKFETSRGVVKSKSLIQDADLLNAVRVYSGTDLDTALKKIDAAKTSPKWLHLYTHDVRENASDFGCTPDDLQKIVSAVDKAGLRVMTVDAAYRTLNRDGLNT